jgi:hypothetical protein
MWRSIASHLRCDRVWGPSALSTVVGEAALVHEGPCHLHVEQLAVAAEWTRISRDRAVVRLEMHLAGLFLSSFCFSSPT